MPDPTPNNIRLSFRVEGSMWNAYAAPLSTMDGAVLLGSIGIGAISNSPGRKQVFMELMQSVVNDYIKDMIGVLPTWSEPERAPEAERAGRA